MAQANEVIVLTSTYRESGLTGLKPVGILFGYQHSSKGVNLGRSEAVKNMQEKAAEVDCTHVFNVQFESWTVGHPNNGEYGSRATGDCYCPIS